MNKCDLCEATNIEYWDAFFFSIPSCRDHPGQPLVVLKEHRAFLSASEKRDFRSFIKKHYPGYAPRGAGMNKIKDHWHEHLIKTILS